MKWLPLTRFRICCIVWYDVNIYYMPHDTLDKITATILIYILIKIMINLLGVSSMYLLYKRDTWMIHPGGDHQLITCYSRDQFLNPLRKWWGFFSRNYFMVFINIYLGQTDEFNPNKKFIFDKRIECFCRLTRCIGLINVRMFN